MKFTCDRQELSTAIGHVQRAVPQKSNIPANEGIHLTLHEGAITLVGYNLELGIRKTLPADCHNTGCILIDSKFFGETVRKCEGDTIQIDATQSDRVTIKSGQRVYKGSLLNPEDYAQLPEVQSESRLRIPQKLLKSMINETAYAASDKLDRPILTGQLFEYDGKDLYVVAMDNYRLSLRKERLQGQDTFYSVIPKNALKELSSLLGDDDSEECEIASNGKYSKLLANGFEIVARGLEGTFNNFRTSMPKDYTTEVVVNRRELLSAATACEVVIDDKNKAPMKTQWKEGVMVYNCKTLRGEIDDEVSIKLEGETITIGLSQKYLKQALLGIVSDQVRIGFTGSNRVVHIHPMEGDSFSHLIMPIKLKD